MNELAKKFISLPPNDQKALKLLASFLLACALLFGGILPGYNYYQDSKQALLSSQELALWMQQQRQNLPSPTATEEEAITDVSIMQLVSSSAEKAKIAISRLQPEGESRVRLWLNDTEFDAFIHWLQNLNSQHQLDISTISIDKTNTAGVVNVQTLISVRH